MEMTLPYKHPATGATILRMDRLSSVFNQLVVTRVITAAGVIDWLRKPREPGERLSETMAQPSFTVGLLNVRTGQIERHFFRVTEAKFYEKHPYVAKQKELWEALKPEFPVLFARLMADPAVREQFGELTLPGYLKMDEVFDKFFALYQRTYDSQYELGTMGLTGGIRFGQGTGIYEASRSVLVPATAGGKGTKIDLPKDEQINRVVIASGPKWVVLATQHPQGRKSWEGVTNDSVKGDFDYTSERNGRIWVRRGEKISSVGQAVTGTMTLFDLPQIWAMWNTDIGVDIAQWVTPEAVIDEIHAMFNNRYPFIRRHNLLQDLKLDS